MWHPLQPFKPVKKLVQVSAGLQKTKAGRMQIALFIAPSIWPTILGQAMPVDNVSVDFGDGPNMGLLRIAKSGEHKMGKGPRDYRRLSIPLVPILNLPETTLPAHPCTIIEQVPGILIIGLPIAAWRDEYAKIRRRIEANLQPPPYTPPLEAPIALLKAETDTNPPPEPEPVVVPAPVVTVKPTEPKPAPAPTVERKAPAPEAPKPAPVKVPEPRVTTREIETNRAERAKHAVKPLTSPPFDAKSSARCDMAAWFTARKRFFQPQGDGKYNVDGIPMTKAEVLEEINFARRKLQLRPYTIEQLI